MKTVSGFQPTRHITTDNRLMFLTIASVVVASLIHFFVLYGV